MIDNFQQIRELLAFPDENSFYFLQLIKRRVDNPDITTNSKTVRNFYIYSLTEFDDLKDKIITLCNDNNARAYIRLNLRNAKRVAFQYLKTLAELLIAENYRGIPNLYESVAGKYHSDPDKKWLIDLDKEGDSEDDFLEWLTNFAILETKFKNEGVFVAALDTKNGVHLITKPFRIDTFEQWASGTSIQVDIHKDNPTILFVP